MMRTYITKYAYYPKAVKPSLTFSYEMIIHYAGQKLVVNKRQTFFGYFPTRTNSFILVHALSQFNCCPLSLEEWSQILQIAFAFPIFIVKQIRHELFQHFHCVP